MCIVSECCAKKLDDISKKKNRFMIYMLLDMFIHIFIHIHNPQTCWNIIEFTYGQEHIAKGHDRNSEDTVKVVKLLFVDWFFYFYLFPYLYIYLESKNIII